MSGFFDWQHVTSSFDRCYDATAGEKTELVVNNVVNTRNFEVKTPNVVIKVNPERMDLVETKTIDGRECLVIDLGSDVEVNGITIRRSFHEDSYEE